VRWKPIGGAEEGLMTVTFELGYDEEPQPVITSLREEKNGWFSTIITDYTVA
jgi:hypothetical protein